MLFYTNVCGNIEEPYKREELDSQLKTEFISALAARLRADLRNADAAPAPSPAMRRSCPTR